MRWIAMFCLGICSSLAASPSLLAAPPVAAAPARPLVTIRLFIDLECPYSRQAWPVYRDVVAALPSAHLIVHHLPLSRHTRAMTAAVAAVAARQQGLEYPFIDALLHDPVPDAAALTKAAVAAGLDGAAMAKFVESPTAKEIVLREQQAGLAFGIGATPSSLINGRGISGVPPAEALARAVKVAQTQAEQAIVLAGLSADVERIGLLCNMPEFAIAFDALRAGRALNLSPSPPSLLGQLGQRYRVELRAIELSLGAADAKVTAVLFVDPASPWQWAQLRDLAARAANGELRAVAKILPRLDARGQLSGHAGAVDVALLVVAATRTNPDIAAKWLKSLLQKPALTQADLESATAVAGLDGAALRKAAELPATTVDLQENMRLAAHVEAQGGSIYLNGRRWLGHAGDSGLSNAIAECNSEVTPLLQRGLTPPQAYAQLTGDAKFRGDAELDLLPSEILGEMTDLPHFGSAGTPVHLFVDFASPHSRAAFFMLKRLVGRGDTPIVLTLASIASAAEPCVTPAGAAFYVADKMGKGLEFADGLFNARNPNDWPTIFALTKKLHLSQPQLQKGLETEPIRQIARMTAKLKTQLDMGEEPVLYIGDQLYQGPLDESRIERAVRFVQTHAPKTQLRGTH